MSARKIGEAPLVKVTFWDNALGKCTKNFLLITGVALLIIIPLSVAITGWLGVLGGHWSWLQGLNSLLTFYWGGVPYLMGGLGSVGVALVVLGLMVYSVHLLLSNKNKIIIHGKDPSRAQTFGLGAAPPPFVQVKKATIPIYWPYELKEEHFARSVAPKIYKKAKIMDAEKLLYACKDSDNYTIFQVIEGEVKKVSTSPDLDTLKALFSTIAPDDYLIVTDFDDIIARDRAMKRKEAQIETHENRIKVLISELEALEKGYKKVKIVYLTQNYNLRRFYFFYFRKVNREFQLMNSPMYSDEFRQTAMSMSCKNYRKLDIAEDNVINLDAIKRAVRFEKQDIIPTEIADVRKAFEEHETFLKREKLGLLFKAVGEDPKNSISNGFLIIATIEEHWAEDNLIEVFNDKVNGDSSYTDHTFFSNLQHLKAIANLNIFTIPELEDQLKPLVTTTPGEQVIFVCQSVVKGDDSRFFIYEITDKDISFAFDGRSISEVVNHINFAFRHHRVVTDFKY